MFVAYNNIREEQDEIRLRNGTSVLSNDEFICFMYRINNYLWTWDMSLSKAKETARRGLIFDRLKNKADRKAGRLPDSPYSRPN